MAPPSEKPRPLTRSKSPHNAGNPSHTPDEFLATLASTIFAGGRDNIDPEQAVEFAFDIWMKCKRKLEPQETVPQKAREIICAIVGDTNPSRASNSMKSFIEAHPHALSEWVVMESPEAFAAELARSAAKGTDVLPWNLSRPIVIDLCETALNLWNDDPKAAIHFSPQQLAEANYLYQSWVKNRQSAPAVSSPSEANPNP